MRSLTATKRSYQVAHQRVQRGVPMETGTEMLDYGLLCGSKLSVSLDMEYGVTQWIAMEDVLSVAFNPPPCTEQEWRAH